MRVRIFALAALVLTALAARAGDALRPFGIPDVGHLEIASPRAPTWPRVEWAIRSLLDGRLPPAARTETAPGAPGIRSGSVAMPTLEERKQMYYKYLQIPDRIQGLELVKPHWMADGNSFWYAEGARENTVIYKVDPVANTRTELFDADRVRAALTRVLGKAPPNNGLPFERFSFVDDRERKVRFALEGHEYVLDLGTGSVTRTGPAPPAGEGNNGRWFRGIIGSYIFPPITEAPAPDGRRFLQVDRYDLVLRSAAGTRTRLTSDGTAEYRWVVLDPQLLEGSLTAADGPPALGNWSPDGRRIAAWRIDERGLPRSPVVHWRQPFGDPLHDQYRVPGVSKLEWVRAAEYASVELYIGDVADGQARWVKVETGEPRTGLGGLRWRPDGSELLFHKMHAWDKRLDLMAADPRTGRTRIVLTETAETFLDWTGNARYDLLTFVGGGRRFIWRSNRDGWYDLYLHDIDGSLVRRLTKGPFEVTWPYAVDEQAGWIYFGVYGTGERPYDTYLHRVRLDGSGFERLADQNGQPGPDGFSPSKKFFLLYRSTPTRPDVVELRRADGTVVRTLARENIDWLVDELGWRPPEEFVVKAADGTTDLQGILFKPPEFDAKKKYPIVQVIYGNPSFTFHAWEPWFGGYNNNKAAALAQLGFVTFVVEERGTHGRGRAFRDVVYRNVGRYQIQDDVATLRQLAAERPYMDLSRVGVVGLSYGGYATLRAMLLAPDVYHVGVAASADWMKWEASLYGAGYREIPHVYEYASNLTFVKNLKGKLLLAQATDDDLHETMILIEALTDAGKPYDLIILPGGGHVLTKKNPKYYPEARIRYLIEHLEPELAAKR